MPPERGSDIQQAMLGFAADVCTPVYRGATRARSEGRVSVTSTPIKTNVDTKPTIEIG